MNLNTNIYTTIYIVHSFHALNFILVTKRLPKLQFVCCILICYILYVTIQTNVFEIIMYK